LIQAEGCFAPIGGAGLPLAFWFIFFAKKNEKKIPLRFSYLPKIP
jgi:hypothetical protein